MGYVFSEMPDGFGWLVEDRGKTYFVAKVSTYKVNRNAIYYSIIHAKTCYHYFNCRGEPIDEYKTFYIPQGLI